MIDQDEATMTVDELEDYVALADRRATEAETEADRRRALLSKAKAVRLMESMGSMIEGSV